MNWEKIAARDLLFYKNKSKFLLLTTSKKFNKLVKIGRLMISGIGKFMYERKSTHIYSHRKANVCHLFGK